MNQKGICKMLLEKKLRTTIHILIPDDWSNDARGNFLEKIAASLLRKQRYKVTERVRFTGMEIDLLADNLDTRQRAFVECKFIRDPFSANVIDLIIGKTIRRNVNIAYLFSTAPPGKEAKGVIDELSESPPPHSPTLAFIDPETMAEMFIDIYEAEPLSKSEIVNQNISQASLIILPEKDPFWVLEEHHDGIPERAIIRPINKPLLIPKETIEKIFYENKLYQGLKLFFEDDSKLSKESHVVSSESEEMVAVVAEADSLDDYRPCRPEYFVGRYSIQQLIWRLLENVRQGTTKTRILSLSGPSGFGKSSIVLKLADRFKNIRWKNKFFLFPVDARSAKGPLFVAKAIKAAFQSAIDAGFVSSLIGTAQVESTEEILQSSSIQKILSELAKTKRVLVVFFDQFEELFTKDELLPTFDAFKRLAFEVNAEGGNLVIGFSWRTGITFSDDNPAYHVWHELSDLRAALTLDEFLSAESTQLVGQFERAIGKKMVPPLRRRLLEQGQGMPWLLKKLCIHVYHEIRRGIRQEDLVTRRLNARSLFDEDLQSLTEMQAHCLKFIAKNSPADMLEVFDQFDQETVNRLYNNRLIVRAGQKYAVYWDIFRDFLVDGIVPAIPWTYVPQVALSIVVRAFFLLKDEGPSDIDELSDRLSYATRTVTNLMSDCHNFLLTDRSPNRKWNIRKELEDAEISDVATHFQKQLKEHVVVQSFLSALKPGDEMELQEFKSLVKKAYSSVSLKSKTLDVYVNRFLPYLRFTGLLELEDEKVRRPLGRGEEFGVIDLFFRGRHRKGGRSMALFLCTSGPERVVRLAKDLKKNEQLRKTQVFEQRARNAAGDLTALELAVWQKDLLVPSQEIISARSEDLDKLIGKHALESEILSSLMQVMTGNQDLSVVNIGGLLSEKLGRLWSEGSKKRYGAAAKRWLSFSKAFAETA